jgi:hypothetical protein
MSSGALMMPSVRLKPTAKILKIQRCRHHHRIAATVVRNGHRGLFRNRTTAETDTAFPTNLTINDTGWLQHGLLRCILLRGGDELVRMFQPGFMNPACQSAQARSPSSNVRGAEWHRQLNTDLAF